MTNYRPRKRGRTAPARCRRPDGSEKATFKSPAKAKQAIVRERGYAGIPLYPYRCPACGYWHVTSRSQNGGPR